MSTDATLTSKGQTTIRKLIRDSLRMKAGDKMTFTLMPDAAGLAGLHYKKGRKSLAIELLSR